MTSSDIAAVAATAAVVISIANVALTSYLAHRREYQQWTRASFEFLLEREPATSILREFSLDVISRYFPGYPAEIRARLCGSDPGTPR